MHGKIHSLGQLGGFLQPCASHPIAMAEAVVKDGFQGLGVRVSGSGCED